MARMRVKTKTARKPQSRRATRPKPIRDVMTSDPVCCLPSDPAQKAARLMREKDTGIVPVIDTEPHRKLVGVVTDRDLCLCLIAEGRDHTVTVQECMTPKIICCHPEHSVEQAVALMKENQIRRLPVVDHDNRIQGIVSMADVVRRSGVGGRTTHQALEKICEPTAEASKPRAESESSSTAL